MYYFQTINELPNDRLIPHSLTNECVGESRQIIKLTDAFTQYNKVLLVDTGSQCDIDKSEILRQVQNK